MANVIIQKKLYLFIGASSVITKEIANLYASQGHHIILAGRDLDDMTHTAKQLQKIGAETVHSLVLDTGATQMHDKFYQDVTDILKGLNNPILNIMTLSAIMPSQADMNHNAQLAIDCIQIGFTGIVSVLQRFIPFFEHEKQGTITIFGSVAGDRGRLNNYIYGASKAGLACFASGLRNHLGRFHVHVLLVKPGFMNTPMIQGLKLPPLPIAQPKQVAEIVSHALEKQKNIIYVPRFWRIIMGIIMHIPEFIFKKLSF